MKCLPVSTKLPGAAGSHHPSEGLGVTLSLMEALNVTVGALVCVENISESASQGSRFNWINQGSILKKKNLMPHVKLQ